MNQVILIGDSIRMGYRRYVEQALAERFAVASPEANCSNVRRIIEHFDEWIGEPAAAAAAAGPVILHINCGLHDLAHKRLDQDNAPADSPDVLLDEYRVGVAAVLDRAIDEFGIPAERIIWATTTPVIDALHMNRAFTRRDADVIAYNADARAEAEARGCRINDLYARVTEAGPASIMEWDGVHFTEEGSAMLGKAVVSAIEAAAPSH